MIIFSPETVAFNLFGFPIYWYGICMALAIFVAIVTANFLFDKQNNIGKKDVIVANSPLIIISGIVGARLYFCLLNFRYYFANPLEILDIRQGGLSIHGALLFGILAFLFVAYKNKLAILKVLDSAACATLLGQAIGRWGNYFNSEAYGLPVKSQNWGLYIAPEHRSFLYKDFSLFHPTFLYESLLDFGAFFVLLFVLFKVGRKYAGLTFFAYLTLYSLIRFFIEQIRIDSALNFAGFPIAQIISLIVFVLGFVGMLICVCRVKHG